MLTIDHPSLTSTYFYSNTVLMVTIYQTKFLESCKDQSLLECYDYFKEDREDKNVVRARERFGEDVVEKMFQELFKGSVYSVEEFDELEDSETYDIEHNNIDCNKCVGCEDCVACYDCKNCKDCYNFDGCDDCNRSSWCAWCKNCNDCRDCNLCEDCDFCTDCENCIACNKCKNCVEVFKSRDCVYCERCQSCVGCTKCIKCTNCSNCTECAVCIKQNDVKRYDFAIGTYANDLKRLTRLYSIYNNETKDNQE